MVIFHLYTIMVAILEAECSGSFCSKDELVLHCKTQPTQPTQLIQRRQPTQTKQPPDQVRRIVRFEPHHQTIEIPHLNDLSCGEIDDIWMNRDDFTAIQKECKAIVLVMGRKRSLLDNFELRGLEHHAFSERNEREVLQDILYDIVEKLMRFSDETSMDVTDLMAEMCGKISKKSEYKARQIALQDEKDAMTLIELC